MHKRKKRIMLFLVFTVAAVLVVPLLSLFNNYSCTNAPGIHYCFLGDSRPRFVERMFGVFDEGMQVDWGGRILTLRGDLISNAEAIKATSLAGEIYTEMRQDAAWARLPSSLGISYERALRIKLEQQQYFVYKPQGEVKSVLVFLHGLGGNFKSYLYLLSQIADQTGSIVIAPSYKAGSWDLDGPEFIDAVVADAKVKFNLGELDMHILGLSNGGVMMPTYVAQSQYRFETIIAVSTYLDYGAWLNPVIKKRITGKKIHYIFGEQDTRIALVDSLTTIRKLKEAGMDVETLPLEGEHFVFFAEREELVGKITEMLTQQLTTQN